MKNVKKMMTVVIVTLLAGLSIMTGVSAQSPEADVFGVVKITNPDGVVANIAALVDKVSPGMGQMASGMVTMQLQQLLQNPEWKGMDKAGEYAIVVLDPMKYPSPVAVIVPITNQAEFVEVLKQAKTGGEEINGIFTFGADPQFLFAGFSGKMGVLADNDQVAGQIKALLDAKSPALSEAPVVKGQLTASVAVSKIMVATRPMIEGMTQMMMMGIAQNQGAETQPGQPPVEAMQGMVQAQMNTLFALLDQTEKLQIGITVNPDESVRIAEAILPVADSEMAKFFAAQKSKKSTLFGFIPQDSAMLMSGSFTFTPEFINGYAEFSKAMSAVMAPDDTEAADKMAQMTIDSMTAMGDEFAMGLFGGTADAFVTYIFNVKDAKKIKQLYEDAPEMVNSMLGMYKNMGMNLDMKLTGKDAYKGGEILNFDLGMKAADIPDPEGQEAFKAFFGEQMGYPMGFVKDYAAMAMGQNAKGQVQKLMDALSSGKAAAPQYTPTQFKLADENNFFMYLSVPKMFKWIAQYAPEVPQIEVQEGPGIGMTARFTKSYVESELVVPVDEILAISAMAQAIGAAQAETAPADE